MIVKHSITTTYKEVKLSHREGFTGNEWKEGLVAGNGKIGVLCAGTPDSEVYIFQNMDFIMPTCQPRQTPECIKGELFAARQAVLSGDDSWETGNKRTFMYPFHPGEQLRLEYPKCRTISYNRETDYESNEIKIRCENENGCWVRKTFVSYEDNVVVTSLESSDHGVPINVNISIDNLSELPKFGKWKHGTAPELSMKYCKFADEEKKTIGLLAHYPSFEGSELTNGGFLVLSKIILKGGECKRHLMQENDTEVIRLGQSPVLQIRDASQVCILTKAVRCNELGSLETFIADPEIYVNDSNVANCLQKLQQFADTYSLKTGAFSYEEALAASVRKKQELFGEVSLSLGNSLNEPSVDDKLCNEDLLQKQKEADMLLPQLVMRVYAQGRYALESCSGYAVPRLCGIWTGEFNPNWAGAYTMDANVNIQVSGMNVGNLYGAGIGYIYFVMKQLDDWKQNAKDVYGMDDAILAPVNTDGSRAMLVEYDKFYPFQYWNAGAAWMLAPIYEFWQCHGNRQIPLIDELRQRYKKESLDLVQEILRPLLHLVMNFWCRLCTPEYYMDAEGNARYQEGKTTLQEGEHYLIIPSYSPENEPLGYHSSITANAAMDLSAARDCMRMIIRLEEQISDESSEVVIAKCRRLLEGLPKYLFDESGALKEWALRKYKDNNEHRHISHLYCAWPAYETQQNEVLRKACLQAVKNREEANKGKDDASSHGWIHRALVAARLKDSESTASILRMIFTSDIFYSTLMTDHDITRERGVYCTDTIIGLVGVIQEMLLYSDEECIEFLPAAAPEWSQGKISGLLTRNGVLVKELSWDTTNRKMHAVLEARKTVTVGIAWYGVQGKFRINEGTLQESGSRFILKQGETVLDFYGK